MTGHTGHRQNRPTKYGTYRGTDGRFALHTCPGCENSFDVDENKADHIATHAPEDFGLSPLGTRPVTDGGWEVTSDECRCAAENDWEDSQKQCLATGPAGTFCAAPAGHDGPHVACNPVEHPAEVWDRESGQRAVADGGTVNLSDLSRDELSRDALDGSALREIREQAGCLQADVAGACDWPTELVHRAEKTDTINTPRTIEKVANALERLTGEPVADKLLADDGVPDPNDLSATVSGDVLRDIRVDANLTQQEVADACDVSCASVSRAEQPEKGNRTETLEEVLDTLCELTDRPSDDELLAGDPDLSDLSTDEIDGPALREIREEAGYSIADVAGACELHIGTVQQAEQPDHNSHAGSIEQILDALERLTDEPAADKILADGGVIGPCRNCGQGTVRNDDDGPECDNCGWRPVSTDGGVEEIDDGDTRKPLAEFEGGVVPEYRPHVTYEGQVEVYPNWVYVDCHPSQWIPRERVQNVGKKLDTRPSGGGKSSKERADELRAKWKELDGEADDDEIDRGDGVETDGGREFDGVTVTRYTVNEARSVSYGPARGDLWALRVGVGDGERLTLRFDREAMYALWTEVKDSPWPGRGVNQRGGERATLALEVATRANDASVEQLEAALDALGGDR